MPKQYNNIYSGLSEFSRLRRAFYRAGKGKWDRISILTFGQNLEENLFNIQAHLESENYRFGPYRSFYIYEPKKRLIDSACFKDRVVHHVLFESLEPIFDSQFYEHSYACRNGRGQHRAMLKLNGYLRSRKQGYILKCDIRKFFPSIDRGVLVQIINRSISDPKLMKLLKDLICLAPRTGLPIGNLTSQLFANIYLNELDQFIKRKLCVKNYIRYMDDFILLPDSKEEAKCLRTIVEDFCAEELKLTLSPHKVMISSVNDPISFLGYHLKANRIRLRSSKLKSYKRRLRRTFKKDGHKKALASLVAYSGHASYSHEFLDIFKSLQNEIKI